MTFNLKLNDEDGRIQALNRLEVLDTPEEAPFENILNLVKQILHVPICAVSLVDRERQWFKARRGLDVCETARNVSFCSHAIQNSVALIVPDALEDQRFAENALVTKAPFIRSYAGIPLRTSDGYNIGTLCAIDTAPRAFTAIEIGILESFSQLILDELELRKIASTDQLSGALSRRAWIEKAHCEIIRAQRYSRPMALAILDLDQFKSINDAYGHPAGDRVIKRIASLCMATMRQSDFFGRLGGEEFGLVMPETSAEGAEAVAERVRTIFTNEPIDLGRPIHASVSIGVADLRVNDTLETLIAHADRALYQAKTSGRNRTCTHRASSAEWIRAAAE